jgi:precorrin-8X/cobalt-precorrin-8 methylmutase
LTALVELIEEENIRPTLVIATPSGFVDADVEKQRLQDSLIPNIIVDGRKGNSNVAVAIVNGLVDLAWQAYEQSAHSLG